MNNKLTVKRQHNNITFESFPHLFNQNLTKYILQTKLGAIKIKFCLNETKNVQAIHAISVE